MRVHTWTHVHSLTSLSGAVKFILPRIWKKKASSPNLKDLLMVTLDLRSVTEYVTC